MAKKEAKEPFNEKVMQANFSALLYLMTEQQALIGGMLQVLLDSNLITAAQLDQITDLQRGDEGLTPTYTQLYSRFATYYLRTKELLEHGDIFKGAGMPAPIKEDDND